MDLLSLHLTLAAPQAEVQVRDARGDRSVTLTGERAQRAVAAAAPLLQLLPGADTLEVLPEQESLTLLRATEETLSLRAQAYRQLHDPLRELARAVLREALDKPPEPPLSPSDAARWEQCYQAGGDGWELGRAAPPLRRFLSAQPLPLQGQRAVVLGAGRGHEARLLCQLGAQVSAVDFAESAIRDCRRLADAEGLALEVLPVDLFTLPQSHSGAFDLLLEHTCYCAIDPARRDEYVDVAAALLRPGGSLVGLFWCLPDDGKGSPPYATTRPELERRLGRRFDLRHAEVPPDSVPARYGQELLLWLARRP